MLDTRNDLPAMLAEARRIMLAGQWRRDVAQMLTMSQDDAAGASAALAALAADLGVEAVAVTSPLPPPPEPL